MNEPRPTFPLTAETAEELYDQIFAPWVKEQGHEILEVEEGRVVTRLPQDPRQFHWAGVLCGQAVMSAIDTAMVLAMMSVDPWPQGGTTNQSTRFLRPATGAPMLVEAQVLKAGRTVWYGEVHVRNEETGALVAHATCEFL